MAKESMVHVRVTHLMGGKREPHPACQLLPCLSLPTPQLMGQGLGWGQAGRDPHPCC